MFRLKMAKKPKLFKLKFNFIFPQIVLANMQEKEITPTKEIQIVEPDRNYDGLSKVIVDKIPDEYIIPSGNLEINQNGTFDVTDKVNAIVNVPEKKLGTKTITTNGTYKATDDNLDGYNEVEVATSGVDINDYINDTFSGTSNYTCGSWIELIKKLPATKNSGASMNSYFQNYRGQELDLTNIDTSNVTNMSDLFNNCSNLTNLDLSNFDTSKATTISGMFINCRKITTLNLSNFNTSNITTLTNVFANCVSLTSLDLSNFDTSKVIYLDYTFDRCSNLKNLNISNFNTSNATTMQSLFNGCTSLETLNLSNFNVGKVTSMYNMFRDCRKITNLDLSSFGESNVTNMRWAFYGCTSLETVNLSNFSNLKSVNATQMFYNCYKLKNLNMSSFDFTKTTNYNNMFQNVPKDCYILVKDEAQKNWFTTYQSRMTNVHYVGEEG